LAGEIGAADYLRVVNTAIDALGLSFEEALDRNVPAEIRERVRELHAQQGTQQIQRVRGVSAEGGPKRWFAQWDPSEGYYWPRQRQYLLDQVGRSPDAVTATDDDSDRVLSYLEDPRASGPEAFDIRGLVIGYVQSGKTENFSAVIAKAADLGYQLIIVLSGVHNALRQQTQRRLERELGLEDVTPGVGRPPAGKRFNNPTNSSLFGDFAPGTSDASILQGNEKVIFIVKKWHTVLERLVNFVEEADVPARLPVLVIDDEADQASINTGGNRQPLDELIDADEPNVDLAKETDPSTTNRLIRSLLSKFQRVSYVAYTATPFANLLIDHRAEDRDVLADLYPKDFLLTLSARPNYVGTVRLFGRDATEGNPEEDEGLDVIRLIPGSDMPYVAPQGIKVADFVPEVPDSMREAFIDWLLATGGILERAGKDRPSAMLIHIHQRTAVQNVLAPQVEEMVRQIRNDWRYDKSGPLRATIKAKWEEEFRSVTRRIDADRDMPFEAIEHHIDRLLKDGVPVRALNSKTEDVLDYDLEPNLKAVLIGGNRLSRGMTIEGLAVSYYVRETPYYDTLLQMARWFGYREQYVDLTRLWTTEILASWFRDLSLREEELRQQVVQAERDRLSPEQVGVRIRSHPAMMVTAQNKMGAGKVDTLSFAGEMIQTSRFRLHDIEWLTENLAATQALISQLGKPITDQRGGPRWDDVDWSIVHEFLSAYRSVDSRSTFDSATAGRYIRKQAEEHHELVRWTVAVVELGSRDETLKTIDLGVDGRAFNAISRTRKKGDRTSIGVLTNPARKAGAIRQGDEEIGLSDEQIASAREAVAEERIERIRHALLAEREPTEGLLVVYPISRWSQPQPGSTDRLDLFDDPAGEGQDVIGIALGFPPSKSGATVEYVTGSVEGSQG
jgi:Z1 domain-containing protein